MDHRSFEKLMEEALRDASAEHHLQVILAKEKHADWPAFYARLITARLAPVLSAIQGTGVSVTVDGEALPPFYSRKTQEEIGGAITSRLHVGE